MKLLREFFRLRLALRHAPISRRGNRRREWHVTVPAPRTQA
ncbi:MAG TPA: hypothetical protein VJ722_12490 [Rhodanobacteraceae bacterium]|nr:hypothetical protein [Rhodanobacteraceae bacterium]